MGTKIFFLFACWVTFFGTTGVTRADSESETPVYHVQSMDPYIPVQEMKKPGVQIHTAGEANGEWTLPTVEKRDGYFKKAHLDQEIEAWDHMDRDLLILRAHKISSKELAKQYPKLPAKKLAALVKEVQSK